MYISEKLLSEDAAPSSISEVDSHPDDLDSPNLQNLKITDSIDPNQSDTDNLSRTSSTGCVVNNGANVQNSRPFDNSNSQLNFMSNSQPTLPPHMKNPFENPHMISPQIAAQQQALYHQQLLQVNTVMT